MQQQKLPELPYDYAALEPVISAKIMELHYLKHHQTYVTKLNEALEKAAEADKKGDLEALIALQPAIRFNGGGHINHSIFWGNLAPEGKGGAPAGELARAIDAQFGSLQQMSDRLSAQAVGIQGSGWAWLGYDKVSKRLALATCANQDPLEPTTGLVPLLGIDVWEHAYYLQYMNVRPDYVKAIWRLVNWDNVAQRLTAAQK